jgi:hypothetical protein
MIFRRAAKNQAAWLDLNKAFACGEKASPPLALICGHATPG